MTKNFVRQTKIDRVIPFVETVEDEGNFDRIRVFVHFDDGDEYELKLIKVDKNQDNGFFYGKEVRRPIMWYRLRRLLNRIKQRF